jgi:nucleoside-diphosphate-sugar epimerase
LRFATAFGLAPRMRFDLTVNEFTRELCVGRELEVYDAHTWRPYCHVLDFARLIDRVLRFPVEEVSFEVFNAGGDRNNHTKKQIVDMVCERVPGARVRIGGASSDSRNYRVDFAKVREKLFFEPRYDVADGIDEIVRAIGQRLLDDVEERRTFYGNYALPGLFTKPLALTRASAREEA